MINSKIQENQRSKLSSNQNQKSQITRKQTNQSSLQGQNGKGQSSTSKNIDVSKMEDNQYRDEQMKKRALKTNKGFMIKNFEIIIELLKFRKSSIEQAYISVLFAFCCLFITNIKVYRDFVDENYSVNNGKLSTVISVLSYLEVTNILKLNATAYQVTFFLSIFFLILIPVLYITCYVMHSNYPLIKVRKFFYGRWFVYAGEYYTWILLQPCYMTLMSYLTCYKPIATQLNLVCDSSDSLYAIKTSLASIALFIGFINAWFLSVFFFNGGFSNKKDSLTCDNTIYIFAFNIYRILFSVMICLKQQSYVYFASFLTINALFSAYLAYQFLLNSGLLTFRNKYIRDLFKFLTIILFAQNVAFALDEAQRSLNIIGTSLSENSSQYTAILSILFYYLVRKMSKSQEYKLITGNELKGQSYLDLKKRIFYLYHLLETAQESIFQDIYFKGIISQHLNSVCFHSESQSSKCFCQMRFLHDSKKNKDVNLDRCYYSINKNIFCKFIIKSWYIQFIQLNPQNYTAIIDYSEFIFNKMRNSCLSLSNVMFLKKKYIYPFDQFRLFRLIQYIHKVNRKKNITSYQSALNVENVIPIEQKIDRIKYKIKQILNQNIEFWNMLLKNVINLEELNLAIRKIFDQIDEIKKMWIRVVVYLNYRKKWRFYYAWYYLYILNQKVLISLLERFSGSMINENEIFIEEYQTDQVEDEVGSVISNTKDDQDKINIKKVEMAFDRRSCVFRVGSDSQGKIIKVNKPVLTTFGFTRFELENHVYITDLMPKTIAVQHPKYTSNFITTGKSKVLYNQKKIFCVMKKGNVFAAWKFLKLYVNLQGETEFVALIRPILNPAGSKMNYIIFNDDWEIDAMTQQMYEYFMIDAEIYRQQMTLMANLKTKKDKNIEGGGVQDNKISVQKVIQNGMVLNILLIIPKLMKFTKLVHYLTPDDQQHFGITQKKENIGDLATFFQKGNTKDKQSSDNAQMQRIKQMTQLKKIQAQKNLAAKKSTMTDELDRITNEDTQITPLNIQKAEELKINGIPKQGSNVNVGPSLTNQDDSIGQLLTIRQKNKENYEEIGLSPKSNKQIANIKNNFQSSFLKQQSTMSVNSRQSSIQEIQDQLHGDIQQQEQIRKQIENANYAYRRKTVKQEENDEEEYDENEKSNKDDDESSQDDDDIESDFGQEIFDSDGKKMIDQRLEKGEQLRLVARVPYNMNQLMSSYHTMSMSRLKKFENTERHGGKDAASKIKSFTHNSHQTFKDTATNLSFQKKETQTEKHFIQKEEQENQNHRDKAFYQLIKDAYTLHVKRKKTRQFKLICTTKFKKIGTRKIGIMKIHNLEEIKFHKMMILQQLQSKNKDTNSSFSKQVSGIKSDSEQSSIIANLKSAVGSKESTLKPNTLGNNNLLLANIKNVLLPLSSQISNTDIICENQDSKVQEVDDEATKENGMGYQLDNQEDSNGEEIIKDIQKDFEKKQGSVTFSLNSVDNIFIKEDIHQPKQQLNSIFQLQLFTRLIFLFILLFNIFTYFLGVNTYFSTIKSQSERVSLIKELNLEILDGYDNMLDQLLLNDGSYSESILSKTIYQSRSGMQDDINVSFFNVTNYFQILLIDSNFQETLFDTSIQTSPATSFIIDNTPQKGNYSYDAFDMFQEYIFHINELNNTMISPQLSSKLSLASPNVDFIRNNVFQYLNKYVFDKGQNAIDIVSQTMNSIQSFIVVITIILSVFVGLSITFMWRYMSAICISFTSIFDSFEKIDLVDVRKIANYYQIVLHQFSYAVDKDEFYSRAYMPITNQLLQESDLIEQSSIEEEKEKQVISQNGDQILSQNLANKIEQKKANLEAIKNSRIAAALLKVSDLQLEASEDNAQVKKNKVIENGKFLRDLKIKILTFYLLFILSVICFSSVYILQIYLNQQTLEKMREDGLIFINPITFNYIMLISLKENAIDPSFYQKNIYPSAKEYIDIFFALKQDAILSDLPSQDYNFMYNQVYKNNTCYSDVASLILSPQWIQDCAVIVQKALLGGLNIFGTKFTEFVKPFQTKSALENQLPSTSLYDDIVQYSRGIFYANIFNLKIMKTWTSDVESNLTNIITFCSVLVIIASIVLLLLYGIFNEYFIIGRLKREYDYFRSVYKMYFPEAIITKKKNIKFWLIKHGILKKK